MSGFRKSGQYKNLRHPVIVTIHSITLTQYNYQMYCNLVNTMDAQNYLLAAVPAVWLIYM